MNTFLKKTFELASKINPHLTAPNPRVGCVIVYRNKIIAQGVHEKFGSNHAEKNAFENLEKYFLEKKFSKIEKESFMQKTQVYITLEPCDCFEGKKTPSCTEILKKYKPEKIIIGKIDPHFKGKNIKKLQNFGFNIELEENNFCKILNPFFEKYILKKSPYICLKVAQSLNGKITNRKNKNQYLTSKKALKEVHIMRTKYSVILTSTETILQDNPSFDVRLSESKNIKYKITNPHLIIIGKRKIPENFNIFKIKDRKIYLLENLDDLGNFCQKEKIDSIMSECGGKLNSELLKRNLVDEIKIFTAPLFLDKNEIPSFREAKVLKNFKIKKIQNLKPDILITYKKKFLGI